MFRTYLMLLFGWMPNWLIVTVLVFVAVILVILIFKLVAFILDVLPFV